MGRDQGCCWSLHPIVHRPGPLLLTEQPILHVRSPRLRHPLIYTFSDCFEFFTVFNFLREAIAMVQVKVTGA